MSEPRTTIEIRVNGCAREVPEGTSVAELLAALGLAPELVAVECNRQLVRRAERATTRLAPGDKLEFVTLVGGG